jgi:hypothetical protein
MMDSASHGDYPGFAQYPIMQIAGGFPVYSGTFASFLHLFDNSRQVWQAEAAT